ncbi:MAG TPA: right-handed parallel beta-helix repeat-containing protein [Candidatus Thermoplasmatota archaeon]|nr:right-handed parallel beta-helix repeat-containing protein [Candidatus Thermoplasmatota archaeon]
MRTRLYALVTALAVAFTPLVLAAEGPPTEPGLPRACERSNNSNTCRYVIPTTTVGPGDNKTWQGFWVAEGTVDVYGNATVLNANVTFQNTSAGFIVHPGGTLRFINSSLLELNDSEFALRAHPGSNFTLNTTSVYGGSGVKVATSALNMSGNLLANIDLALHLEGVTANVRNNRFVDNIIAVNQTGGSPTLESNRFEGGAICVKNFQTNPTILSNVFRGCHVGIYHEQSHSLFKNNDMVDQAEPPGAGMFIIGGQSPVIENNTIRNYGTGIRVVDARAYIRNNTIENNVGAGVSIEGNSAPMDIQGNLVRLNGGDGIRLVNAVAVPVFNNVVESNGGDGIHVRDSASAVLTGNTARANAGAGFSLRSAPDANLTGNVAEANARGIVVDATSLRVSLVDNVVRQNAGDGVQLRANGARVLGGASNANGGHGVRLDHALQATLTGVTANANTLDGVFIGGSQATLHRVNASLNARNGFTYDPMGPFELLGNTPMTLVRGFGNGVAGLYNVDGNATSVRDGWWQGNKQAGVFNNDVGSVIDAAQNYWGSPSGPTHPLNPTGTGDAVVGGVLYHPFRTAPPPG